MRFLRPSSKSQPQRVKSAFTICPYIAHHSPLRGTRAPNYIANCFSNPTASHPRFKTLLSLSPTAHCARFAPCNPFQTASHTSFCHIPIPKNRFKTVSRTPLPHIRAPKSFLNCPSQPIALHLLPRTIFNPALQPMAPQSLHKARLKLFVPAHCVASASRKLLSVACRSASNPLPKTSPKLLFAAP